jgi:hypothetical protein
VNVGTLRTGYPRVQASSQDNGFRLPIEGSSEAATCLRGLGSHSQLRGRHVSPRLGLLFPAQGSSEAATCPHGLGSHSQLGAAPGLPRVPVARAPAPSSGQIRGRHMSPRLGLPFPARGSSEDVTYPRALRAAAKYRGGCARIFQDATRQGLLRTLARHAAGSSLNADETCGSPVAVTRHSAEQFNDTGPQGYCSLASATWATCQPPLWA